MNERVHVAKHHVSSIAQGAAFIGKFLPGTAVYLPSPTWGNHKNIFADSGVEWKEYKYYDKKTIGLDLEGMLADIAAAPEGSVFILHGCAHNPTGVDPTMDEWNQIADAIKAGGGAKLNEIGYDSWLEYRLIS